MSDRTYAQVYIYECPEDQRDALLAALSDTFGSDAKDWDNIPVSFTAEEVPCGTIDVEAPRWAVAAPGAVWVAWEDPKYEWLGSIAYFVRGELAMYPCDAEGNPLVTFHKAQGAGVGSEVLEKLFRGHAVIERFETLASRPSTGSLT